MFEGCKHARTPHTGGGGVVSFNWGVFFFKLLLFSENGNERSATLPLSESKRYHRYYTYSNKKYIKKYTRT